MSNVPSDPDYVQIERIRETNKTIRYGIVACAVVAGLIVVVFGIIKVLDKPPWLVLMLAILAALLGPSGVILVLLRSRSKYIAKQHPRIVALEMRVDPTRSSSIEDRPPT